MTQASDIAGALSDLVGPDSTVFVHSSMLRARSLAGETTEQKLTTVVDGLRAAIPDGALMMPTFTYSYCEGEIFDVERTPSTVGQLTEFFRTRPGVRRTTDPIFSTAVQGEIPAEWDESLFGVHDHNCFGPESVFQLLLDTDGFVCFLGTSFDYCTFVHRVEQEIGVPYRYLKDFEGTTRLGGVSTPTCASFFVRDLKANVVAHFMPLEARLRREGALLEREISRGFRVTTVLARAIRDAIRDELIRNPDFLLARGHDGDDQ